MRVVKSKQVKKYIDAQNKPTKERINITNIDKELIHAVIDELPPEELNVIYKMFLSFINDYKDRHLTPEEHAAHIKALEDDEWYD